MLELGAGLATADGALVRDALHVLAGCAVLMLNLRALVIGHERLPRLELVAAFSVSCFLAFTVLALLAEGYRVKGELFSEYRHPASPMAPSSVRVAVDALGAAMFFTKGPSGSAISPARGR